MNKKFSIGIPIFNEEYNIARLLKSIQNQNICDFDLEKIIIYNDGSTDNTELEIKKILTENNWLKNKVEYISASQNKGKAFGLNVIFEKCNSEFCVLIDSDMILKSSNVLASLLMPMFEDKKIGLSNGWYKLEGGRSILGKVLNFSLDILKEIGKHKNFYTASGAIMILREDVYKKIIFPEKITRIDSFMYLFAIKSGYRYLFNPKAEVVDSQKIRLFGLFWFVNIQKRSTKFPPVFDELFSKKTIEYETALDLREKATVFLKVFLKKPLSGILYFFYKTTSVIFLFLHPSRASHLWRR